MQCSRILRLMVCMCIYKICRQSVEQCDKSYSALTTTAACPLWVGVFAASAESQSESDRQSQLESDWRTQRQTLRLAGRQSDRGRQRRDDEVRGSVRRWSGRHTNASTATATCTSFSMLNNMARAWQWPATTTTTTADITLLIWLADLFCRRRLRRRRKIVERSANYKFKFN